MGLTIGAGASVYDDFTAAIPGACGRRLYARATDGDGNPYMPDTWPSQDGARDIYSIYPNLDDLLAGQLDSQLHSLCASAPPHSAITVYHEPNVFAGKGDYPSFVNPASFKASLLYVKKIAGPYGVLTGIIGCGPAPDWSRWVPADGLDYYGIDVYQGPYTSNPDGTVAPDKLYSRLMNPILALARNRTKLAHPRIFVCECNSNYPQRPGIYNAKNRGSWFKAVASWLHGNDQNGNRMLTFWNATAAPEANLGGPWDPDDSETIGQLKWIQNNYCS